MDLLCSDSCSCGCPCALCPPPCLHTVSAGWTLMECCSVPPLSSAPVSASPSPLPPRLRLALFLSFSLLPFVSVPSSLPSPPLSSLSFFLSLCLSTSGLTPALACAPSREVADCLALILATMMPFCSPCSSGAPSPGALLRQLPHQGGKGPGTGPRGPRSPRNPSGPSSEGTTENDSEDSETFWPLRTDPLPSYLHLCTWIFNPPMNDAVF